MDVLRVMSIRIAQGRSPFSPDKNHVHHRLLTLYGNHLKVTITIVSANLAVIGLALWLNHTALKVNIQFVIILLLGVALSLVPSVILRRKAAKDKRKKVLRQYSKAV